MSVRRVGDRVPLDEAVRRAVAFGRGRGMLKASQFASAIWPDATFLNAQGEALAAGRVIAEMKRRGLVRWETTGRDWGWVVARKAP